MTDILDGVRKAIGFTKEMTQDQFGLLRLDDDGRVIFPYDAIHVDFLLRAA